MVKSMSESLLTRFNEIEKLHWWWEGRRQLLSILLEKDRPKRILDVGCGTGETLTFLKMLFPKTKLYGIDLSEKALKYSRGRGHKNIYKANALRLPFTNSP